MTDHTSEQPDSEADAPGVPVHFHLEDPRSLVESDQQDHHVVGRVGESLLDTALRHGIAIEHACGGVCACSTCHVHVIRGPVSEAEDDELDRVEQAPDLTVHSRLSCQCVIEPGPGPIEVNVPAWNRNAAKETPH